MKFEPIIPIYILIIVFGCALFISVFLFIKSIRPISVRLSTLLMDIAILSLCFVCGLRPMVEDPNAEIRLNNLDVMFVLDTTISMWADDGRSLTRMNDALKDCDYIMEALPGANFALITYDNHSFIRAPFTQDCETIRSILNSLSALNSFSAEGTDMNIPYNDIRSLLLSSSKKENREAIVFFLSDGEKTVSDPSISYEDFSPLISGGAVMGYGTDQGGRMKQEYGYVFDPETGRDAISVIDEETLMSLSSEMGIDYVHMTSKGAIDNTLTTVRSGSKLITQKSPGLVAYKDIYYYFIYPVIILLIIKAVMLIRLNRKNGKAI